MFLKFYNLMVAFLQENGVLIALLMAIVEYVKRWVNDQPWYEGWMMTSFAFVVSVFLAIPETGFVGIDWFVYAAEVVGLFVVSTGLYKVSETVVRKVISA